MVYNEEKVNLDKYNDETTKGHAVMKNKQFSVDTPVWINYRLSQHRIEDESDWFNVGISDNRWFTHIDEINGLQYSSWTRYPDLYKFISVQV
jgi:hypothetical protein